MNIEAIIKELRRPFTPEGMNWKVQTAKAGGKAMIVGFIDSRQVNERLNHICPGDWSDDYSVVHRTESLIVVECGISIMQQTRSDVGEVQFSKANGIEWKSAYSDAFKRAAVKWGIGVPLYYMPRIYFDTDDLKQGKYLASKHLTDLKERYARWVGSAEIVKRFGEPLDLGEDHLAQQGETEAPEVTHAEDAPESAPPAPEPNGQTALVQTDAPTEKQFREAYKAWAKVQDGNAAQRYKVWCGSKQIPHLFEEMSPDQAVAVLTHLTTVTEEAS
jgi:hypothetical protein